MIYENLGINQGFNVPDDNRLCMRLHPLSFFICFSQKSITSRTAYQVNIFEGTRLINN